MKQQAPDRLAWAGSHPGIRSQLQSSMAVPWAGAGFAAVACRRAVVELAGQSMVEAGRHWGSLRPKTAVDLVKGETGAAASMVELGWGLSTVKT